MAKIPNSQAVKIARNRTQAIANIPNGLAFGELTEEHRD